MTTFASQGNYSQGVQPPEEVLIFSPVCLNSDPLQSEGSPNGICLQNIFFSNLNSGCISFSVKRTPKSSRLLLCVKVLLGVCCRLVEGHLLSGLWLPKEGGKEGSRKEKAGRKPRANEKRW